jgi:hypothetical protein
MKAKEKITGDSSPSKEHTPEIKPQVFPPDCPPARPEPQPQEEQYKRQNPLPEIFPEPNHPLSHAPDKDRRREKGVFFNAGRRRGKQAQAVLILLFLSFGIKGQTLPRGPHEGRMQQSGDYVLEMLGCMDHLEVYLYDKNMKYISNVGLTGNVAFHGSKTDLTSNLASYGRDGFSAKIPSDTYAYCVITVSVNDKQVSASFTSECLKVN